MERIWAVLVNFFTNEADNRDINSFVLIAVLATLLIALYISIVVARKNNLFHKSVKKENSMSEAE